MDEQDIEYASRMSYTDNLMWVIEQDPHLRSTITGVTLLDGTPDRERLQRRMEVVSRNVIRLRQRVVSNAHSIAPPRWEVDPNFNLAYHLRWTSLGGHGTGDDLLRTVEPIVMQGFDRARPLWEFTLVEGLEGGRSALVMKSHHTITDGVGAVRIMMELFDAESAPSGRRKMPRKPTANVLTQRARAADALVHETRRQADLAAQGARLVDSFVRNPAATATATIETTLSVARMLRPATRPLSPLMTERSLDVRLDRFELSVPRLKEAAKRARGKLNDAYVTGVARGFARYHGELGSPVDTLRMGMPINVRRDGAHQAGNQFSPARVEVPVSVDDPVDHMRLVRGLVARQRAEPALALAEPMAGLLSRLPGSVTTGIFGVMMKGLDFLTSNVPGIPVPVFLEGVEVLGQIPFGPLSGAAANVTLLSYLDTAHVGLTLDRAAVTEPELLHRCIEESFTELFDLT